MFERFTERARKVVVLAQDEAGRLRHEYIGTEHLLLGLLHEEAGVAAQALSAAGVTLDGVRGQVEGIVGYGEDLPGGRQAPFTQGAKDALELSLSEALRLGHNYIGTEHILLGLARESEGVAARVLSNLDVDPDKVRREVFRGLPRRSEPGPLDESERRGEEEDSLDRVEREMEEGAYDEEFPAAPAGTSKTVVRVKGRPRTLLVDLISVGQPRDGDEPSGATEPGRLLHRVAELVGERDYRSVDEAIERSGELVLERLPAVDEIEVSFVRERWFERRTGSGITKTRTFRR